MPVLTTRQLCYVSLFAALTAVGALVSIPLPWSLVPVTLQTFFIYLAALILGGYLAALSQIIYLGLGIIGLPVFANGSCGLGVLLGPTGGYLWGFVIASFTMGILKKIIKRRSPYWWGLILLVGTLIIYFFGVVQLKVLTKIDFTKAIAVGILPFLPGDIIKIVTAGYLYQKLAGRLIITE